MKDVYIAVDFDGTCVEHEFPAIGRTVPHCVSTLKWLHSQGAKLILHTMRSGEFLQAAVNWFGMYEIPLFGINNNPTQKTWTASPKTYAHIYIDDAALGCPLIYSGDSKRPYVDWETVKDMITKTAIFIEPIHHDPTKSLADTTGN